MSAVDTPQTLMAQLVSEAPGSSFFFSALVQLSSVFIETIRTLRNGEPRTATSTLTRPWALGLAYSVFTDLTESTPPVKWSCG